MKTTSDIRAAFLDYFKRQGHDVLPSSSLIPHNDPTLMFTAAGMVQFKNMFTGVEKLANPRAATSQKCVRAGGKHNDLDNVGYTARHHTFFEMLGNFSFGDYFKEEAILFGWEFLTKDMGLNPDRLCVTVYHDDDFAWNRWKKLTGFPDHKIIRINSSDNFWSAGDTGPCGPCSEIFYDHGEHIAGGPPGSAEADGDRFVEIWNLVFMQFDQLADGSRVNLPKPSIDTGMGLERISAVIQGVHDNYDIDIFRDMIRASNEAAELLGSRDQLNAADKRTAHRVLADHLRSACFLIADGVMPSNEGRGYVLRRIMRRAMRYAHQLGCADPLMYRLVPNFVQLMGGQYPELKRAEAMIIENLKTEEERFKQTLERGLKLLEESIATAGSTNALPGDVAFKLYDTYGFPLDLTQDILRGRNMSVDTQGFDACMERQKEMARAAWKGSGEQAVGNLWFAIKERVGATEFVGYDEDACDATIVAIVFNGKEVESITPEQYDALRNDRKLEYPELCIILNKTPFYGESGGQVGDKGSILRRTDSNLVKDHGICWINNTRKPIDDLHVHYADPINHTISVGDRIIARIDTNERNQTRANHSATHLLHKALRNKLGEHVTQKGSLVAPNRLRFDFSHGKAVDKNEILEIEKEIGAVVARGTDVQCQVMSPDAAIQAGAMALFGEKYGDEVRVLTMGQNTDGTPYSIELCGGTHVRNLREIGAMKVVSEGSVASGVRRIEAVTGEGVRAYYIDTLQKQNEQLKTLLEAHLKLAPNSKESLPDVPLDTMNSASFEALNELFERVTTAQMQAMEHLQETNKKLAKQQAEEKKKQALAAAGEVKKEMIGEVAFIGQCIDGLPARELRALAENLLKHVDPAGVVVAIATDEGKASVIVAVSPPLIPKFNAVDLVKIAVATLGGQGGGGKPEFAQGGGSDVTQAQAAISAVKNAI
jgi:alanyl-tRNA synthetase